MSNEEQIVWVDSGGGPLLLVSEDLLGFWEGARRPAPFRTVDADFRWEDGGATDYDRACDVRDYVGVIDVGPGQGLVLGDEPLPTAWLPCPDGRQLLVRWVAADDDGAVLRALSEVDDQVTWERGPTIVSEATPMVLFDSAHPGDGIATPSVQVTLPKGQYAVETARFDPDPDTSLVLHRLVPVTVGR